MKERQEEMEEREIIKSVSAYAKPLKRIVIILLVAAIILTLGTSIIMSVVRQKAEDILEEHHRYISGYKYKSWDNKEYQEQHFALWETYWQLDWVRIVGVGLLGIFLVLYIFYLYTRKMQVTVTDKRVYGQAAFGKRVDLPLDSISVIGQSAFRGLAVATSAGKIKFVGIENRDDIHSEITHLLTQRQGKPVTTTQTKQEIPQSNADEIRKFKKLLDCGIITQEEFDAKKKQLLGL